MKPVRTKAKNSKKQKETKERQPKRWLLNSYIGLLIFINGIMFLILFLLAAYSAKNVDLNLHPTIYAVGMVLALATIYFLVNLFYLRLWGFWGYALCTVGMIALNIASGTPIAKASLGIAGPIIMFCLLYMGGPRSAWRQMRRSKKTLL